MFLVAGIGGMAGSAAAQNRLSSDPASPFAWPGRGSSSYQSGQAGSGQGTLGSSTPVRQGSFVARPFGAPEGVGSVDRRGPAFDEAARFVIHRGQSGPDESLARREMTRLSQQREQLAHRGVSRDELRRLDSEMDRLEPAITNFNAPDRRPWDQTRAPMRASWPRPMPQVENRKIAPFSDQGGQALIHEQARPFVPAGHPDWQASTNPANQIAGSRIVTAHGAAPHKAPGRAPVRSASNGRAAQLLKLQQRLTLMRRNNAPASEISAMELRARALRSQWKQETGPRQTGPGLPKAMTPVDSRLATHQQKPDPAQSPFWRRNRGISRGMGAPPAPAPGVLDGITRPSSQTRRGAFNRSAHGE